VVKRMEPKLQRFMYTISTTYIESWNLLIKKWCYWFISASLG
jgi:hypothetical protein